MGKANSCRESKDIPYSGKSALVLSPPHITVPCKHTLADIVCPASLPQRRAWFNFGEFGITIDPQDEAVISFSPHREILNAVLFLLIGLEVLLLVFTRKLFMAGFAAVPLLLLARWMSVGLPMVLMKKWHNLGRGAVTIMTWGGLRGGISVALALSLPKGDEREWVLALTYILVVFSILIQGPTVSPLVKRTIGRH